MTGGTGPDLRGGAGQLMPPWLWVWLIGDLAVLIPGQISDERYQFAEYTGHGDIPGRLTAGIPYKLLFVFGIIAALTYVILAAGAVAALFPHLRGRWVERRFRLAGDDRDVIAEMQDFVGQYDPSIQLRVAVSGQQLARIYPVGWRKARIAVFLPLLALWYRDRRAAQAVLLHEIAHRRHGDQFVVGLGSPFTWLIRVWVPAFLLLVLTPIVVYAALGGGLLAQAVSGQGALELLRPAELLILPVVALWLAEFNADEFATHVAGPDALRHALEAGRATEAPIAARALTLLSHPPRRLRLRSATPRPAATAALLAAWPAALIAQLGLLIAGAFIAYLLIGQKLPDIGTDLLAGTRQFLTGNRILLITAVILLLGWPVLARPWDRLWSPRRSSAPYQPWRPYLAAAAVPVALLAVSFAPLSASYTGQSQAQDACAQLAAWDHSGGMDAKLRADSAAGQAYQAMTSPQDPAVAARTLESAAASALRDPPPGAARDSYVTAMTDLGAFARDVLAGRTAPAGTELANGLTSDEQASSLLAEQIRNCSVPVQVPSPAVTATPVPSTAPAPGSAQLTAAQLKARLLTQADLAGYAPTSPPGNFPSYSDKPACIGTLNDLSSASAPSAAVTQATAVFTAGPDGPWVEEVARSYPGQGAAQAFAAAVKTLAGCGTFTLGRTAAAGTESVRPLGSVNLGRQSWSAAIATQTSIPVTETLILAQEGSSLVALQVASAAGLPPAGQIRSIAAQAIALLIR